MKSLTAAAISLTLLVGFSLPAQAVRSTTEQAPLPSERAELHPGFEIAGIYMSE